MFWLHLYAAVQSCLRQPRTVDRGCQPAPGPPCALFHFEGEASRQSSGETSCEDAKVCLQVRCESKRDALACTPSLRAQRSNPVCRRGKILDFFTALATTLLMQRRAKALVSRAASATPSHNRHSL